MTAEGLPATSVTALTPMTMWTSVPLSSGGSTSVPVSVLLDGPLQSTAIRSGNPSTVTTNSDESTLEQRTGSLKFSVTAVLPAVESKDTSAGAMVSFTPGWLPAEPVLPAASVAVAETVMVPSARAERSRVWLVQLPEPSAVTESGTDWGPPGTIRATAAPAAAVPPDRAEAWR